MIMITLPICTGRLRPRKSAIQPVKGNAVMKPIVSANVRRLNVIACSPFCQMGRVWRPFIILPSNPFVAGVSKTARMTKLR
ncbi:hypothetical protein KCU67_g39, partial [Aureobasidium melanogenum]